MKIILLTQFKLTIVDDYNYNWLIQWNWHAIFTGGLWYAVRRSNRLDPVDSSKVYMHQQILNFPSSDIDHINRDGLDNQLKNLRLCTASQNLQNSKKHIDNSSGFKGITWDKWSNKWKVQIRVNNKKLHIGRFDDLSVAIVASKRAIEKYHKEFGRIE